MTTSILTLEERLKNVEKSISENQVDAYAPVITTQLEKKEQKEGGTVTYVGKVKELLDEWNSRESSDFRAFHDNYNRLETLLGTEVDMKDLLMNSDMMESILLSGMNEFKSTAGLLQAVDKLKVYIDKAPIENLHEFEKNLSTVELQMNVNQTAVKKYHAEVEDFLSEYNSIINTMSQNFLLWNAMLTKWEEKVDKKLGKKR